MQKLVVITSEPDELIIAAEKNLQTTNKPFTRQKLIFEKIRNLHPDAKYVIPNIHLDIIEKELRNLNLVDPKYLDFLKNVHRSYQSSTSIDTELLSPFDGGIVNYLFSKQNIDINKIPYHLQCGIYGNDYCTSIFAHTYVTALRSAYHSIIAKRYANDNSIVYCLNTFPGHHATHSSYSGYCFINNAAICARLLSEQKNKVAILDVDFHHGDGTQKIFYDNHNILTISIHGHPKNYYPFYTGYTDENTESNMNYPLNGETHSKIYFGVLAEAMEKISQFGPEYLVLAFGADTYANDPEGGLGLQPLDYVTMGQYIRKKYQKQIFITQEGGYYMDMVPLIVCNLISGLRSA